MGIHVMARRVRCHNRTSDPVTLEALQCVPRGLVSCVRKVDHDPCINHACDEIFSLRGQLCVRSMESSAVLVLCEVREAHEFDSLLCEQEHVLTGDTCRR